MLASCSTVATVSKALERMQQLPELQKKLWSNANMLYNGLIELGYEICSPASPILAVRMKDEATAVWVWNRLLQNGVYVNLALNAFEAMGQSGMLQIKIERSFGADVGLVEAPYVRIRFRDSGAGLETGQEATIFEPFHTTKPQGTGLGLSIAARIVESHGGRLEARTHSQGGAEFTIDLPEVTGEVEPRPSAGDWESVEGIPVQQSESVVAGEPVGEQGCVMEEQSNGR